LKLKHSKSGKKNKNAKKRRENKKMLRTLLLKEDPLKNHQQNLQPKERVTISLN
jgi:hypothetical protein